MSRRATAPLLPFDLTGGPDFSLERRGFTGCGRPVAGTDEAGRGPLAGPVVAAAVILDDDMIPSGLNDSKKLTAARREQLFNEICRSATVAIAVASPARIDHTDIRRASLWAMAAAVRRLALRPGLVLADGRDVPEGLPCPGEAVIKGDARSLSIAAASIVAKVTRDRLMSELAVSCPGYGFERHKGYGTAAHMAALKELGPSPYHRATFAPVRELIGCAKGLTS